jgi:putative ABC transport system ATP-binding protein
MSAPLLKLVNVSKIYQMGDTSVKALQQASLEIKEGEFAAIMGPSGSGKSTLMHLAGCLDSPTSGKVYLKGKDISHLSEAELARIRNKEIGFVFQTFNLIPRVPAVENVALPLVYAGLPHEERLKKAKEALKRVGLEERVDHLPNQLSGGEQQRVAIARALVTKPTIIFADEPTGNLDTKTGEEIMKFLTELNQKGHTIIVVTHEQEIADFTKRIIKIRDGKVE